MSHRRPDALPFATLSRESEPQRDEIIEAPAATAGRSERGRGVLQLADNAEAFRSPHEAADAIEALRGAIRVTPGDTEELAVLLVALARALVRMNMLQPDQKWTEEAIERARRALELMPESSPQQPEALGVLASALSVRYHRTLKAEDQRQVVSVLARLEAARRRAAGAP